MMDKLFTVKNIFVVLVTIYAVVSIERHFSYEAADSDSFTDYKKEQAVMELTVQSLQDDVKELDENQNRYEKAILKVDDDIDGMSDEQLDSLWARINPR